MLCLSARIYDETVGVDEIIPRGSPSGTCFDLNALQFCRSTMYV